MPDDLPVVSAEAPDAVEVVDTSLQGRGLVPRSGLPVARKHVFKPLTPFHLGRAPK